MQIEIISFIGRGLRTVLADQNECREKDRLDRRLHGQNNETRIKMQDAGSYIPTDPHPVYHQMQIDKPHAAGECGDPVRQFFLPAGTTLLLLLLSPYSL